MSNNTQDQEFIRLSQLSNHLASFTVGLEDGSLIDTTEGITQQHATSAHKLLQNASLLIAKQQSADSNNGSNNDNLLLVPAVRKITVTFKDYTYGFTLSNEKIYAVSRANLE
ncbi:6369_t:CDS:2 [Ambispora gerdemannii]|uniref:6369_t:CDS:1 n=1 Tax=Ambispora gerdemannii TaxID=144530 RepID=A0A9N8YNU5_9GLOM|nr:6369_t:CDS:2 [Ambispora gerdemannii]